MMSYAQAQGDLLKHALMTGTLPPHVQGSSLFQKTAQRVGSIQMLSAIALSFISFSNSCNCIHYSYF